MTTIIASKHNENLNCSKTMSVCSPCVQVKEFIGAELLAHLYSSCDQSSMICLFVPPVCR